MLMHSKVWWEKIFVESTVNFIGVLFFAGCYLYVVHGIIVLYHTYYYY